MRRTIRFVASIGSLAAVQILIFPILSAGTADRLAAQHWKSLGPNGGNFTVIKISPSDSEVIYVGTMWGGLYKSTDAGDQWSYLGFGGDKIISSIAVDPHDPDRVYFSWYTSSGLSTSGVSKSIDGGQSWQTLPLSSARTVGTTAAKSNVVFAGNDHGLFRSTDGGGTFDSIAYTFGFNNLLVIAGDPKDSSLVYVGTESGVYKSTDEGTSWQLLVNVSGSGIYPAQVAAITISPSNETVLVSTEMAGLFISRDGGAGWSQENFGLQVYGAFSDPHQDSTIYAVTVGGFLKSTDMGHNFSLVKAGHFEGGSMHGAEIVLIDTDSATIFRSTDLGVNWSEKVNGITDVSIQSIVVQPGGDRSLLAILSTGYKWQFLAYHNSQWDTIAGAYYDDNFGSRLYERTDDKTLYMIGGWNYVARSSDGGKSWIPAADGVPYCSQTDLAIDRDTLFLAATYSFEGHSAGIFKSTNRGTTWSYSITDSPMYSIAADRSRGHTVYAGGGDGALYRSSDGGTTWAQVNLLAGRYARQILVRVDSSDGVFVVASSWNRDGPDSLYRSTDGGKSLSAIGCGLDRVLCITYASDQKTLYAGGHSGVVRSTDAGLSWHSLGPGLDSVNVTCIIHDSASGVLYCGTSEGGAFRLDVPTEVVRNSSFALPREYTLGQNFPNPFNPTTTISYALPLASNVRLSIFNTLGQEILTLVNRFEGPGNKSVRFEAGKYPTGVYFYRISAGGFIQTKKMILIR